jgi:hypothetical protein
MFLIIYASQPLSTDLPTLPQASNCFTRAVAKSGRRVPDAFYCGNFAFDWSINLIALSFDSLALSAKVTFSWSTFVTFASFFIQSNFEQFIRH